MQEDLQHTPLSEYEKVEAGEAIRLANFKGGICSLYK